jgi:molybdate transport system ATP-binding protein
VVASAPLAVEEKVRIQILARDVSITLQQQCDTSILNIIPVSIGRIVKEKNAQVTLRLIAGATPLLARITLKSCQDLSLKEGDVVYAQIKTVAILS